MRHAAAEAMDFARRHRVRLAWGALAVVVLIFGAVYLVNARRAEADTVQLEYDALMNPNAPDWLKRARELAEQSTVDWIAADMSVQVGNALLRRYAEGTAGADALDEAERHFLGVVENHAEQRLFLAKALLGLGRVGECRKDAEAAETRYDAVLAMDDMKGYPVWLAAKRAREEIGESAEPVVMAAKKPAPGPAVRPVPSTRPVGEATTGPADG